MCLVLVEIATWIWIKTPAIESGQFWATIAIASNRTLFSSCCSKARDGKNSRTRCFPKRSLDKTSTCSPDCPIALPGEKSSNSVKQTNVQLGWACHSAFPFFVFARDAKRWKKRKNIGSWHAIEHGAALKNCQLRLMSALTQLAQLRLESGRKATVKLQLFCVIARELQHKLREWENMQQGPAKDP